MALAFIDIVNFDRSIREAEAENNEHCESIAFYEFTTGLESFGVELQLQKSPPARTHRTSPELSSGREICVPVCLLVLYSERQFIDKADEHETRRTGLFIIAGHRQHQLCALSWIT